MPNSRIVQPASLYSFPCAAALAFALVACDKPDRPGTTGVATEAQDVAERKAAFEQDVRDLKSKGLAPDSLDAALAASRVRHGFPLPVRPQPADVRTGQETVPGPAAGALAKTAINKFYIIRETGFGYAPTVNISVPANSSLEAWTSHPGGEDPMLVGFYKTADLGNSRFTTRDIGVSDDEGGGTDAYLIWKNTTGASRSISLVAFAYSSALTGSATLSYRIVGQATKNRTFMMDAVQMKSFTNVPTPAGCSGPTMSLLNLYKNWGGQSEYALLAVNRSTRRGGWSFAVPDLTLLEDILPRNTASFILGYKIVNPNDQFFEESGYRGNQTDVYSCP